SGIAPSLFRVKQTLKRSRVTSALTTSKIQRLLAQKFCCVQSGQSPGSSCCSSELCVSLRGTVRRTMMITLPDWFRRARIAAVVAFCVAAFSLRQGEPLKAAQSQQAGGPSNGLEILAVRPSFFVIAGAGSNIGVQVGEDGVVVVDSGSAANTPAVLAAI